MKISILSFSSFLLLLYAYSQPQNLELREASFEPTFITRDQLESSIKIQHPGTLERQGKIYVYDNLVFINELYKGVYVVDNSKPENPKIISFISIPGNVDIAIKNGFIYADNSVDMVALKYESDSLRIISRIKDTFHEPLPPDNGAVPARFSKENRPKDTYIIA